MRVGAEGGGRAGPQPQAGRRLLGAAGGFARLAGGARAGGSLRGLVGPGAAHLPPSSPCCQAVRLTWTSRVGPGPWLVLVSSALLTFVSALVASVSGNVGIAGR